MLDQTAASSRPGRVCHCSLVCCRKAQDADHSDSLLITRLVLNWIFPALLLASPMGTYVIAFAIGGRDDAGPNLVAG